MTETPRLVSERVKVHDSLDEINGLFYERGWTDGLPIVPPTPERVNAMLAAVDKDPQEQIALLAPKTGIATVEKIAINAVMAGALCK